MPDGSSIGFQTLKPQQRSEKIDNGLRLWAPAKINLNLLVSPVREDGFHGVDSYISKIAFYDQIDIQLRNDGQIRLGCSGADCGSDDNNLALRAAMLLADGREIAGADISLIKKIPPGKGLGGGSSDAAAVLYGLNELWNLGVPSEQLLEMAAELGSDVPLFLGPPSCRVTGRGEIIQQAEIHDFFAILFLPEFSCATASVYKEYDSQAIEKPPQLDADFLAKNPPSQFRDKLINQLTRPAKVVCGELGDYLSRLAGCLGVAVSMTGSGSAMFVLCDSEVEVRKIFAELLEDLRADCVIVTQNPF